MSDTSEYENERRMRRQLNQLYSEYFKDSIIREIFTHGRNSAYTNIDIDADTSRNKLTKYAKWLRDVVLLVENFQICVSIATPEMKNGVEYPVIYVNRAFEKMTQYSREEMVGKNSLLFLQGETKVESETSARERMIDAMASGYSCDAIITNVKKDGTEFRNFISLAPIKYKSGEICYYLILQTNLNDTNTPYNYMTLFVELLAIIPETIEEEENLPRFDIQDLIDTIGLYNEIETEFPTKYPIQSPKRSIPHRRSSTYFREPIRIDEHAEECDLDVRLF